MVGAAGLARPPTAAAAEATATTAATFIYWIDLAAPPVRFFFSPSIPTTWKFNTHPPTEVRQDEGSICIDIGGNYSRHAGSYPSHFLSVFEQTSAFLASRGGGSPGSGCLPSYSLATRRRNPSGVLAVTIRDDSR